MVVPLLVICPSFAKNRELISWSCTTYFLQDSYKRGAQQERRVCESRQHTFLKSPALVLYAHANVNGEGLKQLAITNNYLLWWSFPLYNTIQTNAKLMQTISYLACTHLYLDLGRWSFRQWYHPTLGSLQHIVIVCWHRMLLSFCNCAIVAECLLWSIEQVTVMYFTSFFLLLLLDWNLEGCCCWALTAKDIKMARNDSRW